MTTTDDSDCQNLAEAGQLVVDTNHLDAVREVLCELKIQDTVVDEVPDFDLALLGLEHVEAGKDEKGKKKVPDLDAVLTEVRVRIGGLSGGWTPVLGKNRDMTSDFGAYPQTKGQSLWDPQQADQPSRWLEGDAGSGVRVGLLDTKIYGHEDIPDCSIEPIGHEKFTTPAGEHFIYEEGHGVFAAGLILQQAPGAKIVARAALGADGKAPAWCVVKKLAEFLADEPPQRVQLVVLASGCRTHDGKPPLILERAIERLSPHIMVVAAAGNHGAMVGMSTDVHITRNSPTWPAALPGVVAAGVPTPIPPPNADPVEFAEKYPDYSPKLPWVTCTVDNRANGVFVSSYLKSDKVELHSGITVDSLNTGYASWRGTSCAAAHLGGAIAAKMASSSDLDAWAALENLYGDTVQPYHWTYSVRETP